MDTVVEPTKYGGSTVEHAPQFYGIGFCWCHVTSCRRMRCDTPGFSWWPLEQFQKPVLDWFKFVWSMKNKIPTMGKQEVTPLNHGHPLLKIGSEEWLGSPLLWSLLAFLFWTIILLHKRIAVRSKHRSVCTFQNSSSTATFHKVPASALRLHLAMQRFFRVVNLATRNSLRDHHPILGGTRHRWNFEVRWIWWTVHLDNTSIRMGMSETLQWHWAAHLPINKGYTVFTATGSSILAYHLDGYRWIKEHPGLSQDGRYESHLRPAKILSAGNPKQCVVRIPKGTVERT